MKVPEDDLWSKFEAWYEQDMLRLFNYISYRVGDKDLAQDLTAMVCEKAIDNLERHDPRQSTLNTWIFGIARNELMHYFRHHRRTPRSVSLDALLELRAEGSSVEEIASRNALTRSVVQRLNQLDEREQEIIALRYGADLNSAQIARLMNLSAGNVRVMLHRTMEKLHALLVHEYEATDAG